MQNVMGFIRRAMDDPTPYVVMVGDPGTGKSTVVEKLTGQEPTEPRNTAPWLADNQSRDLNNEFWFVVYVCRLLITGQTGRSSNDSRSVTRTAEPFWTYDGSMVISDTPGCNAMDDKMEQSQWIAGAINFMPLSKVHTYYVVSGDVRPQFHCQSAVPLSENWLWQFKPWTHALTIDQPMYC